MFETEDFDLDEDFLKDIGEKEEEYYSQRIESDVPNDPPAKRQRVEPADSDILGDITFDDEPDFAKNINKPVDESAEASSLDPVDSPSKKKPKLDVFAPNDDSGSKNASHRNTQLFYSPLEKSLRPSSPKDNPEMSRKALALEILRRGTIQKLPKNTHEPSTKSNDAQKSFSTIDETPKKIDITELLNRKKNVENFKKPAERSLRSFERSSSKNSRNYDTRDRTMSAPRMTLIRKFPGPAGLLPDSSAMSNLDHANFLNGLDIRAIDENNDDSKISDYCSQNTERLFTSGAWRFMLDDLPQNFLKGHEIATIKRPTRDSRENSRAKFLAGVVQTIDTSVENPRLLLKDMTDSIEATLHSDVQTAHPNVIEPGCVLLLRDAGLLGFQGSQKCPGPQYHLMIAPRNVLAVYSEKARLITSTFVESLKNTSKTTNPHDKDNRSFPQTPKIHDNEKNVLSERNKLLNDDKIVVNDFPSDDDDDDDIAFACFNVNDIEDSEISNNFSNSKLSQNFGFGKKMENTESKKMEIFGGKNMEKSPEMIATKLPSSANVENAKSSNEECLRISKLEIQPKKMTEVRSKLSKFRSDEVSTPPDTQSVRNLTATNENVDHSMNDNRDDDDDEIAKTFGDDLLASDNDTEDEILSQLDVESIMTNYNAASR